MPQKNADANAFAAELQSPGLVVGDANDPLAFAAAVLKVLRQRPPGWKADDVIADYVGLTSHASVGTMLACLQEQAPIPAEHDANLKPIRPLPPFEVILQGRSAGGS